MNWLRTRIPPPIVVLILGIHMALDTYLYETASFAFPHHEVVGGIVALLAISIGVSAALQFKKAQTTLNPHRLDKTSHLVTTGIFAQSRNPMYLALLILLISFSIILANAITWLHPILFVLYITFFQIKPEEEALMAKFGEDYLLYRTRTRRWL